MHELKHNGSKSSINAISKDRKTSTKIGYKIMLYFPGYSLHRPCHSKRLMSSLELSHWPSIVSSSEDKELEGKNSSLDPNGMLDGAIEGSDVFSTEEEAEGTAEGGSAEGTAEGNSEAIVMTLGGIDSEGLLLLGGIDSVGLSVSFDRVRDGEFVGFGFSEDGARDGIFEGLGFSEDGARDGVAEGDSIETWMLLGRMDVVGSTV